MSKSYPPIPYGTRVRLLGGPKAYEGTVQDPVKAHSERAVANGDLTWKEIRHRKLFSKSEVPGMDYKTLGIVSVIWDEAEEFPRDGFHPDVLEIIPPVKRRFRDGLTS